MGILDTIKTKLFGKTTTTAAKTTTAATTTTAGASAAAIAKAAGEAAAKAAAAAVAAKAAPVDVEATIERLAKENGYKGNWRVSIVDLLKSLGMDSSLDARKELAKELGYTGSDPDGSAEKNTWLLKTLMKNLAESGGTRPKGK